jgi:adenylosuccinate lyase
MLIDPKSGHADLKAAFSAALENIALWGERDISHSSVERIIIPRIIVQVAEMIEDEVNNGRSEVDD